MATGGSKKETSGLAAPPLKKTTAASVAISKSSWLNSSSALAFTAFRTRHWASALKRTAMPTIPSKGNCGSGMSSAPGTIKVSRKSVARTSQRLATSRRRVARVSAEGGEQGKNDMGRIMRDLSQFSVTWEMRQFAAPLIGVCLMPPLRHLASCLALAVFCLPGWSADLDKGKEINGTCAACHGEFGQGGKKGEYPRIAGQQVRHIESQLKSFRARIRVNIPMFPYTQERELSDEDIKDISAYLNGIKLDTKMPTYTGNEDSLTRLLMAEKVMIIPRAEGDLANGEKIFQKQCAGCHGKMGKGKGMFPMLVGQYTNYLQRQVDLYLKGDRPHDEVGTVGVLNGLKAQDIQDILAYLTSIQDTEK